MQRPPKTLDVWTAEIFADLSGPTNSILQRRMDINTGVLDVERQLSCAHGAVVCVDEIYDSIFGREFEPLQNSRLIFWKWWQIMHNFPLDLMLCHVFTVTMVSTGLKIKIELEIF